MAHTFNNVRLHRENENGDKSGTFYWDVETGEVLSEQEVRELAGKEHFFVPEMQKPLTVKVETL